MQEILLKIRYFERIIKKPEESQLYIFFLSNPVPFSKQNYQKQKRSETSQQSLFRSQNKFRKIPLFIIYYYLTNFDDAM